MGSEREDGVQPMLLSAAERALVDELRTGSGHYYVCQERAFAPRIADGWPRSFFAPHTKNGRLVLRQWPGPTAEAPDARA